MAGIQDFAVAKKKQAWGSGDVFLIKTEGDFSVVGQVIGHEPQALNSVGVALFDERVDSNVAPQSLKLDVDSIFSILLVTRDLLDSGVWKIVGSFPITLAKKALPYERLRPSGFVGAKIIGSGILNTFVGAYYGLLPWDSYKNPNYFDDLLVSPNKKPAKLIFKDNDVHQLQQLLATNENIDQIDGEGRTLLMRAAIDGKELWVKYLLEKGANVDAQDNSGFSALHFAAQDYYVGVVRMLIAAGAKMDVVDKFGNTPLWRAVLSSRGRGDVIRLLLDGGADRNLPNKKGRSPLDLANTIANFDVKVFFN